jgi:hypothetical protein
MSLEEARQMWAAAFADLRNAIIGGDDRELIDAAKRLAAVEIHLVFVEGIRVPPVSLSEAHAALRQRVLDAVEV